MTKGEWCESFLIEAATSIRPPLSSTDWKTKNLSILDIAEDACEPWIMAQQIVKL